MARGERPRDGDRDGIITPGMARVNVACSQGVVTLIDEAAKHGTRAGYRRTPLGSDASHDQWLEVSTSQVPEILADWVRTETH